MNGVLNVSEANTHDLNHTGLTAPPELTAHVLSHAGLTAHDLSPPELNMHD